MSIWTTNSHIRQRECLSPEQKTGVLKLNKDNIYPLEKIWSDLLEFYYKSLIFTTFKANQL